MPNSDIADDNKYSVYRNGIRGGGVLIMIKKSIWSKDRSDWLSTDERNNKIAVAQLRPTTSRKIATITAYSNSLHVHNSLKKTLI